MGIKSGYVRLSRDEDGQGESIEGQKSVIINYYRNTLQYKGEIIFFVDDNYTGMNFNRPGFQELKREAISNNLDIVVFKDLSRFGRDCADTQKHWKEFALKYGVRLISASQGQDSNDRHTRKTLGLYTWLNEQYIEDISEKIIENFRARQKKGDLIITVPYGYIKKGRAVVVDELAAGTVKKIFELYIMGNGYRKIAALMNSRGIITPSAYKNRADARPVWNFSAVKNILTNEFYTGTLFQGKTFKKEIKGRSFRTSREELLRFPGNHEAIIPKETFDLVQRIKKERDEKNISGTKKSGPHLFSGKIICNKCGKTYVFKYKRKDGPGYYICGTYHSLGAEYCKNITIAESWLTDMLQTKVMEKINKNTEVLAGLRERINKQPDAGRHDRAIARLNSEIEKREQYIKKIYRDRLVNKPGIPDYILNEIMAGSVKELNGLKRQLESAVYARDNILREKNEPGSGGGGLKNFLSRKLSRRDIEILIEKININNGIIEVHWNI